MRSLSLRAVRSAAIRPHARIGRALAVTALGASTALAAPAPQDDAAPKDLVLSAKRVIVRPGKVVENAKVHVRDGKIVAVGADVEAPDGATVLEGEVVCAAFIDPWSTAGIESGAARSNSSNSATLAVDAIDPYGQEAWLDELVEAGVLLARTQVGTAATYGGIAAVIRAHAAEPILPDAALTVRLGITRGGGGFVQQIGPDGRLEFVQAPARLDPIDRVGQVDRFVNDLRSGEKYAADLAKYERDLAAWEEEIAKKEKELQDDFKKAKKARDKKVKDAEEDGKELKEKKYKEDKRPRPPKYDPEKAAFARAAEGEIPLVVHAERAMEIRELLRLTKGLTRLRMVIAGGTAALACADDLAERNVPVIVVPSPSRPGGPVGELDPGLSLASELHDRGVEVLIGSGGANPRASRDLPLLAALAVGYGLDADAALRAITLGPARVFDVANHVGSVQRGRHADLLLLSGDPLSSSTRVLASVSGGEVVHQAGR